MTSTINLLAARAEMALGRYAEDISFADLMLASNIAERLRRGEHVDVNHETRNRRYKWQREWIKGKVEEYSHI